MHVRGPVATLRKNNLLNQRTYGPPHPTPSASHTAGDPILWISPLVSSSSRCPLASELKAPRDLGEAIEATKKGDAAGWTILSRNPATKFGNPFRRDRDGEGSLRDRQTVFLS